MAASEINRVELINKTGTTANKYMLDVNDIVVVASLWLLNIFHNFF